MQTFIAVRNVIAWLGLYTFGCLTLSAVSSSHQLDAMSIYAALGAGLGLCAYFQPLNYVERSALQRVTVEQTDLILKNTTVGRALNVLS